MAKEIKDIQQLINDKADRRLDKDIRELETYVDNGKSFELLRGLTINIGSSEKPDVIQLSHIFTHRGFKQKIRENNTERYRQEETSSFLERVESIREDVDSLMNSQQDL